MRFNFMRTQSFLSTFLLQYWSIVDRFLHKCFEETKYFMNMFQCFSATFYEGSHAEEDDEEEFPRKYHHKSWTVQISLKLLNWIFSGQCDRSLSPLCITPGSCSLLGYVLQKTIPILHLWEKIQKKDLKCLT